MPKLLFDLSSLDLTKDIYDQEQIRQSNPQRGAMEHLNGIVYVDAPTKRIVGYKDVRADEFWVPGHIPGRPLLPGVIMIETGAQLASFYTRNFIGWTGFVGFGAVEDCKFRASVTPGCRMYVLGQQIWERHHRVKCLMQGVVDGNIVFEAGITGVEF